MNFDFLAICLILILNVGIIALFILNDKNDR